MLFNGVKPRLSVRHVGKQPFPRSPQLSVWSLLQVHCIFVSSADVGFLSSNGLARYLLGTFYLLGQKKIWQGQEIMCRFRVGGTSSCRDVKNFNYARHIGSWYHLFRFFQNLRQGSPSFLYGSPPRGEGGERRSSTPCLCSELSQAFRPISDINLLIKDSLYFTSRLHPSSEKLHRNSCYWKLHLAPGCIKR